MAELTSSPVRTGARVVPVGAMVSVAALAAWAVTAERMQGMDAGPGTDLGGLTWFLGVWATMMAAMMLPATAPAVVLFARTATTARTASFVAGYLLVWVGVGLVAYTVQAALDGLEPLAWDRAGRFVAAGAVAAAGLYQLTPLKTVCLRRCRSPLHLFLARHRPGAVGAARMGAEHGLWCAGCCWALMLVLFALGVMSLAWMAAVAAVVLVEKALPGGERLTRPIGVALLVLGAAIAAAPGAVPLLHVPGSGGM